MLVPLTVSRSRESSTVVNSMSKHPAFPRTECGHCSGQLLPHLLGPAGKNNFGIPRNSHKFVVGSGVCLKGTEPRLWESWHKLGLMRRPWPGRYWTREKPGVGSVRGPGPQHRGEAGEAAPRGQKPPQALVTWSSAMATLTSNSSLENQPRPGPSSLVPMLPVILLR